MIIYYDSGTHPLLREHFKKSGADYSTIFRSGLIQQIDRCLHHHISPRSLVYNRPACRETDDKIIVFDTYTDSGHLKWLCRQYPDKRIILWFWNTMENPKAVDMVPRRVEIWSYSKRDCSRYGFRYNTTFYFDDLAKNTAEPAKNPVPRVLFVGREKGREAILRQMKEELEKAGAQTEFHIMRNNERKDTAAGREHLMSYDEVTGRIRAADVIFDYTLDPEAGPSLRTMEALFWGKKLITNNRMVRDCRFYCEDNIYLLGEEKRSLNEFFETPLQPADREVRDYYLLSSWLKRFDEG